MGKTKVVLDTNVLISALGWNGVPRKIVQKCLNGDLTILTSSEQIDELRRVMDYPKFTFTEEQKNIFISIILEVAEMVEITGKLKFVKDDPDDDAILETALAGNAEYIVSGDLHLLSLETFANIKIVTAAEFSRKV